jgi:hypothetical protein
MFKKKYVSAMSFFNIKMVEQQYIGIWMFSSQNGPPETKHLLVIGPFTSRKTVKRVFPTFTSSHGSSRANGPTGRNLDKDSCHDAGGVNR